MPATPSRIGFILNQFRRSVATDDDVKVRYGSLARESDDPVETFFVNPDDAEIIAAERLALLSADRRRFRAVITDVEGMIDLDLSTSAPLVRYVDPNRSADMPALVAEVAIDLGRDTTTVILWG